LMHKAANDHTLPALMKYHFGGLKKFLQIYSKTFIIADDHPYNPHVELRAGVIKKPIAITKFRLTTNVPLSQPPKESVPSNRDQKTNTPLLQAGLVRFVSKKTQAEVANLRCSSSKNRSQDAYATLSPFTNPYGFVSLVFKMLSLGLDPKRTFLAHICIVSFTGQVTYNKYAKLCDNDADFHSTNGIHSELVTKAINASAVRCEVIKLLKGKVIIGHSVSSHLQVLALNNIDSFQNSHMIRDIASYSQLCPKHPLPLNMLVKERLGVELWNRNNHPVTDARAILAVYKSVAKIWEAEVFQSLIIAGTAQAQRPCEDRERRLNSKG